MGDLFVDEQDNVVVSEGGTGMFGRRLLIHLDAGAERVDERPCAALGAREVERLHEALGRWLAR